MGALFDRYIAAAGTQNTSTEGPGSKVDVSKPQEKKPEAKVDTPSSVPVVPVPGELVGEPGVKLGDLGQRFRISKNINNKQGLPIVGRIYASKEKPEDFEIQINDTFYGENAAKLKPESLAAAVETKRRLHLVKFVLDNNLERSLSINPTEREMTDASNMFDVFGSANSSRISKAYALVDRAFSTDPNAKQDAAPLLLLDSAFARTGQSLSTYYSKGENVTRETLPTETSYDSLKAQRDKEAATFSLTSLAAPGKYVSRFEARIKQAEREIKQLRDSAVGLRGDNPQLKKIDKAIEQLNADRQSYITQDDQAHRTWTEEQTMIAKNATDHANRIATMNATIQNIESSDAAMSLQIDYFNNAIRSWIGTAPEDDTKFNGWIAEGVANWLTRAPNMPVGGKVIPMLPNDYLTWVKTNKKYGDFKSRTAGMRLPDAGKIEEIIQLTSDQDKLVAPLQELYQTFEELKGESGPNLLDKFFNPKYAAQENNVFHIMAARRKFVTGGGNPSNYEQEMLLSGISNPGKVFSLADLSKERLKTIAYLTILDHARTMQKSGFRITKSALDHYNRRYSSVLGHDITAADINRHMHTIDTFGLGSKEQGYDPNTESGKRANSHFERFHQLMMLEDEQRRAGK
jgi:hypothetical protein